MEKLGQLFRRSRCKTPSVNQLLTPSLSTWQMEHQHACLSPTIHSLVVLLQITKNQPWPMPINNGVLSPYFSTRSIFLCPLATCNQRYYLPTTLPVQQLNIVQSQYPLFTIGRWTYKKTSMFARIFKSPPFTTSTLNDVFTYLAFSHISPNFDLHYSFVLADVVFHP